MTDAMRAHNYAMKMTYAKTHREAYRAASLRWYAKNKQKANNASWRYDQSHYQERLAYWRERSRRINDSKRKIRYKPRHSRRVPECAENTAHARSMIADARLIKFNMALALMK